MSNGALSDLKVLELGNFVSGPWCAKQFADLGAEVIKVEEPGLGDEARTMGPFPGDIPHPEKSGLFLYLNTNKRGITLQVKHPTGRKIFLELVKQADLLVENHRPQEIEELGLTYQTLREVNPRLIMTSISPFGQTGPYRDYKGSDLVCFQMGGVGYETPAVYVTDPEEQQPLRGGGYQTHFLSGWLAASTSMVALFHRHATGEGQQVDISEQEAAASMVRPNITLYSYEHRVLSRLKENFMRLLPTKDGHITFGISVQAHWLRLLKAMGNPEWAQSEAFADRVARTQNYEVLELLIPEWTTQHTTEEIFRMAQELDFSAYPLNNVADLFRSEQYAAREFFVDVDHPVAGKYPYPRTGFILSKTPWQAGRAPLLGEHNETIYGDRLGYSKQDLVRLRQAGVI